MERFTFSQMVRLPRISDIIMPTDKEFFPARLITDCGLYEAVLIDTADMQMIPPKDQSDTCHLAVSKDVRALHRFMQAKDRIMLPCPDCRQNQPFDLRVFLNPRLISDNTLLPPIVKAQNRNKAAVNRVNDVYSPLINESGSIQFNAFDRPSLPVYQCGNDFFLGVDYRSLREFEEEEKYRLGCALLCADGICNLASEIRRDYVCTMNESHRGFADYVIYQAVDRDIVPECVRSYEERKAKDPNTEMTMAESQAVANYEKLKTCLIMEKVGQYPSMADIAMFEIDKYRAVLKRDRFNEFKMALGLYASGVGCGSFVYLRRIFEGLVSEAEQKAAEKDGWDTEEYKMLHFNEKIEYLETFGQKLIPEDLPEVKNKLFGILSKGIHESSEQECKELFPYMKFAIEELLDHKLQQMEHEKKRKDLRSILAAH